MQRCSFTSKLKINQNDLFKLPKQTKRLGSWIMRWGASVII